MVSPDFANKVTLTPVIQGGYVELTIPELVIYSVVVISGEFTVNIESPQNGYLYLRDQAIMQIKGTALIFGEMTVAVNADSDSEIDKVEFYIYDVLKNTDTEAPYRWIWDEYAMGRHEIKAIAFLMIPEPV